MNKCKYCNKEFKYLQPYSKVCFECKVKSYNNRERKIKRECLFCKKEYLAVYEWSKFCSIFCGQRYRYSKNRIKWIKYSTNWIKKHPEKRKEYQKKYQLKNRDLFVKKQKKYGKRNPHKLKAQRVARYHIQIPKNQICESCNKELAIHRHHKDLSFPLKILFIIFFW